MEILKIYTIISSSLKNVQSILCDMDNRYINFYMYEFYRNINEKNYVLSIL